MTADASPKDRRLAVMPHGELVVVHRRRGVCVRGAGGSAATRCRTRRFSFVLRQIRRVRHRALVHDRDSALPPARLGFAGFAAAAQTRSAKRVAFVAAFMPTIPRRLLAARPLVCRRLVGEQRSRRIFADQAAGVGGHQGVLCLDLRRKRSRTAFRDPPRNASNKRSPRYARSSPAPLPRSAVPAGVSALSVESALSAPVTPRRECGEAARPRPRGVVTVRRSRRPRAKRRRARRHQLEPDGRRASRNPSAAPRARLRFLDRRRRRRRLADPRKTVTRETTRWTPRHWGVGELEAPPPWKPPRQSVVQRSASRRRARCRRRRRGRRRRRRRRRRGLGRLGLGERSAASPALAPRGGRRAREVMRRPAALRPRNSRRHASTLAPALGASGGLPEKRRARLRAPFPFVASRRRRRRFFGFGSTRRFAPRRVRCSAGDAHATGGSAALQREAANPAGPKARLGGRTGDEGAQSVRRAPVRPYAKTPPRKLSSRRVLGAGPRTRVHRSERAISFVTRPAASVRERRAVADHEDVDALMSANPSSASCASGARIRTRFRAHRYSTRTHSIVSSSVRASELVLSKTRATHRR